MGPGDAGDVLPPEALLGLQRRVLEMLARGDPLQRTLETLLRDVEAQTDGLLASVLLVEDGTLRHGAAPSLPRDYVAAIDGVAVGEGVGSCGTAAATGKPVHVEDVLVHPYWADFRDLALEHGLRACWSMPILVEGAQVVGTFALYYRTPRLPTMREETLIAEVSTLAGLAIEHDRLRRAEREQMASTNRIAMLKALVDQIPIPITLLAGPDLVYEVANPAALALVNRKELVGRRVLDVFPELVQHPIIQLLQQVYRTGVPVHIEESEMLVDLRATGTPSPHHFNLYLEPYRGDDGGLRGVIALVIDVTTSVQARREVERLLAASREHARHLDTLSGVTRLIAHDLDPDRVARALTEAAKRATGAASAALIRPDGEPWATAGVPPESATALVQGAGTGARSLIAAPVERRSGGLHGTLYLTHPKPDAFTSGSERVAKGIAGQAGVALDNAELFASTLESQRHFRILAQSLPAKVWQLRPDGEIEWSNEGWRRYAGATDVGRRWTELAHPDDREKVADAWERATNGDHAFDVMLRLTRADGEHRWHIGRAVALLDVAGHVRRWVVTGMDVHEERTSQEELGRMRAELQRSEKLSALGQLVSGVAHEIRTPLTYLTTNLHLLAKRLEQSTLDAESRRSIEHALEAVDRIDRLVEDLRPFAAVASKGRKSVGLAEATRQAVHLFEATHRGHLKVVFDAKADIALELDKLQVQQAVLNLLQNAAEARPRDHTVRVRVEATPAGGRVSVVDTGPGIPAHVAARVFDPFFTTKQGGTGLGLSIARRAAEEHGGSLSFVTGKGGTTFHLDIPKKA